MHIPTTVIYVLLLLCFSSGVVHGDEESDFFRDCPIQNCSHDGPKVRYPLRLKSKSTPKFCGAFIDIDLSCSGNQILLTLPTATFAVTAIDYTTGTITTKSLAHADPCPLRNLTYMGDSVCNDEVCLPSYYYFSLMSCSKRFTPTDDDDFVGPISCLSGGDDKFVYAADAYEYMTRLPLDCMVLAAGFRIPDDGGPSLRSAVDSFNGGKGIILRWNQGNNWELFGICQECEAKGGKCWYSQQEQQSICRHGRHGNY